MPVFSRITHRMPRRILDITGRRFGKLVVTGLVPRVVGDGPARWICRCDCGCRVIALGPDLRKRKFGCRKCVNKGADATRTHGGRGTPEYRCWGGMKMRCHNPKSKDYKRWGGRGIFVCAKWRHDFQTFLADMGQRPSRYHTIDRIDNDGPYAPSNCRWATKREQGNNRGDNVFIEFSGRRLTKAQWAAELGVSRSMLGWRLNRWGVADALTRTKRRQANSQTTTGMFDNLAVGNG